MNEKFFDLKKDKQDRMINAALKAFALEGYRHASTDEIIREAGISKGLLFHYFESKAGLYGFLADYALRYAQVEYSATLREEDLPYSDLWKKLVVARANLMRQYPYLLPFLDRMSHEQPETVDVALPDPSLRTLAGALTKDRLRAAQQPQNLTPSELQVLEPLMLDADVTLYLESLSGRESLEAAAYYEREGLDRVDLLARYLLR